MATSQASYKERHLAAIYVHAGAGYHSVTNEQIHLRACATAASMGMLIMKNGGSALDAVEKAVRCLEDNEITNAGYGSNLNMDGTVECDATIVDHLGRSGAVGAITNVRNPISIARIVYDESIKPMVLKRVPPNLLTGSGATDFAFEHGVQVLENEAIISPAAEERFKKWKIEIELAKGANSFSEDNTNPYGKVDSPELKDIQEAMDKGAALSHNSTIAALANESQSFSPAPKSRKLIDESLKHILSGPRIKFARNRSARRAGNHNPNIHGGFDRLKDSKKRALSETKGSDDDRIAVSHKVLERGRTSLGATPRSNGDFLENSAQSVDSLLRTSLGPNPGQDPETEVEGEIMGSADPLAGISNTPTHANTFVRGDEVNGLRIEEASDQDFVVDTVGAIAIDSEGRIAAASSSGGIGMKHRGRIGPAALVGIGTAVMPAEKGDEERKTVACVTSGTGEHMATSMAAQMCAMRILTSTKVGKGGLLDETDEDDALKSFVQKDFMGHPGIKASHSSGAIGAMVVKRSRDGMWLYWVHNTDSFALASMHADDNEPHTTMSRNRRAGRITTGARSMRGNTRNTEAGAHEAKPEAKRRRSERLTDAIKKEPETSASLKTSSSRHRSTSGKVRLHSRQTDKDGSNKEATIKILKYEPGDETL